MNEAARIIQHALLLYCIRKEQEKIDADFEKEILEMENDSHNQNDDEFETTDLPQLSGHPVYPIANPSDVPSSPVTL
ncbi:hypothetical protein BSL78_09325 [Apostichopus japonicus]|uniref:Uncharacterized protein n=1 Tax=Stichopus japonicus TaxID=307972 RepID=A0A2G8L0K6_STIJA|nr:hypothetical protein BSL78_09325 [Apostichopus japonicus]